MPRHWLNTGIWLPLTGIIGVLLLSARSPNDREVSQHFLDTYTYSHLTRGILLFAVLCRWANSR